MCVGDQFTTFEYSDDKCSTTPMLSRVFSTFDGGDDSEFSMGICNPDVMGGNHSSMMKCVGDAMKVITYNETRDCTGESSSSDFSFFLGNCEPIDDND